MSTRSRWFVQDYATYMLWRKFGRHVLISTAVCFTGYSLTTAQYLQKRFDLEYLTEDYKHKVLGLKFPGQRHHQNDDFIIDHYEEEEDNSSNNNINSIVIDGYEDSPSSWSEANNDLLLPPRQAQNYAAGLRPHLPSPQSIKNVSLKQEMNTQTSGAGWLDIIQREQVTASAADYLEVHLQPLQDWADVARACNIGDILLVKGTGNASWKITNLMYAWMLFDPWALRYSHTAVVVDVDRSVDPPNVLILEAVDNRDASIPSCDHNNIRLPSSSSSSSTSTSSSSSSSAPVVRHQKVQVVNARDRVFALHPEKPGEKEEAQTWLQEREQDRIYRNTRNKEEHLQVIPLSEQARRRIRDLIFGKPRSPEKILHDRRCYSRASFRRLEGLNIQEGTDDWWTQERKEKVREFVKKNVDRPMTTSPLMTLAQIHPMLYQRKDHPEEITCSELIYDLYKELGLVLETKSEYDERMKKEGGGVEEQQKKMQQQHQHQKEKKKKKFGEFEETRSVFSPESLQYVPYHFTAKGQRRFPFMWTGRLTKFGAEEKVRMDLDQVYKINRKENKVVSLQGGGANILA